MEVNEYQTNVTDEMLKDYPQEVQDQFWDAVNNIEFIRTLISPNRKRACDLDRDADGKIIVDVIHPHILENMDYFRPAAIYFQKHGCYTSLKPNGNPNSEFGKFIRQERDRCWNGMVRESDGEWITGQMYFYLNYCPIKLVKKENGRTRRVTDFPRVWEGVYLKSHYIYQARYGGIYNEFRGDLNGAELASRGKSKSYFMAAVLAHNFIFGEDEYSYKDITTVVTAGKSEYLTNKDGLLSKFVNIIDFLAEHTQFPRRRLIDSMQNLMWKIGYKDAELNIAKGLKNEVIGVLSKDDESKIRGKRASFIGIEECGSFARLKDMYNVILPSVRQDDEVFGIIYMQGTAGDNDNDFAGAKEIMYHPDGYYIYSFKNVYDKANQGKLRFCFFFPSYLNREGCYNKDGVSDVTMSLLRIFSARYKVKYNSEDPRTIIKAIAERPVTPSEAMLDVKSNMFPSVDLSQRVDDLDNDSRAFSDVYVGALVYGKDTVEFTPTCDTPIRSFPHKDNKIAGAIEIWEMPETDKQTGKPYAGRYILSCDPYDDDSSNTMSLGSIFVLDLWKDELAAEYTGRPMFADDFFDIAMKMCIFYNGIMNYENNKKGLFAYFQSHNRLYMLTDTLEFLKDKQMIKESYYGNKAKGTNATLPINNYGRALLRDWFIKPVTVVKKVDGQDVEVTVPNLTKVRSRALLQEAISWNNLGNFDRISSMGMLMLFRQDRIIVYGGDVKSHNVTEKDYIGNDDFFKRNFDDRYNGLKSKFLGTLI